MAECEEDEGDGVEVEACDDEAAAEVCVACGEWCVLPGEFIFDLPEFRFGINEFIFVGGKYSIGWDHQLANQEIVGVEFLLLLPVMVDGGGEDGFVDGDEDGEDECEVERECEDAFKGGAEG